MSRIVLCVTGPMAAGKNAVCSLLEEKGFLCIDADICVHDIVDKQKDKIMARFGDIAAQQGIEICNPDGTINRRALGSIVFSDPELLKSQEAIIHPAVEAELNDFIDGNPDKNIVLNATVLYKTRVIERCDAVIFVTAPLIKRFFRVKSRDSMPAKQILSRFYSQREIFAKYKKIKTDIYKVRNSGSKDRLKEKLDSVLCRINSKSG
ncbi:MAG: dephospho-CoA kinase [Spirochaetaceae bacterium]|nr:dephospho-CoA kinase [Spirochaetaceae bacterium]